VTSGAFAVGDGAGAIERSARNADEFISIQIAFPRGIKEWGSPTGLAVRSQELCVRFTFAVLNAGDVDCDVACIVPRPARMIFERRAAGAIAR
jgi:hypothetical protein